jgi:hypothetical protein
MADGSIRVSKDIDPGHQVLGIDWNPRTVTEVCPGEDHLEAQVIISFTR